MRSRRRSASAPQPSRAAVSRERQGTVLALCLFVLLLVGAFLEFTRERQPTGATDRGGRAPAVAVEGPVLPDPGVAVPLRRTGSFDLGDSLTNVVSDGVSPSSGLWNIDSGASATTVRALFPRAGRPVRLETDARPDGYDVARWTRERGVCAFLILDHGDGSLTVDVRRVATGDRVGVFRTQGVPRPEGSQRTLLVGRWSGPNADLFVLDRGRADKTTQVRVLSGESGFKSVVLAVVAPHAFHRRDWAVDLEDVAGSGHPDLVFTTRFSRTTSGRIEVHVLAAQTNYSRFLLQVATRADAAPVPGRRALAILRDRRPFWVLFNVETGRAFSYPLAAGPARRTSPR